MITKKVEKNFRGIFYPYDFSRLYNRRNIIIMQKIINGIAIFSGAVALGIVGLGGYVYIRKDAIIEDVKGKVLEAVVPDLGGIAGDALPDVTGPALPSSPF